MKNVMASLRSYGDSDCKKTQIIRKFHLFISYLLRFSDRIDRMKNSYRNFFIQSQSRVDFLTRGKSSFIQSEISCQNESVSSQTRSRCFWRLFKLHSKKFVEFPQVYSNFLEICHKPQTKIDKPIKKYIQEEQSNKTLGQKPYGTQG